MAGDAASPRAVGAVVANDLMSDVLLFDIQSEVGKFTRVTCVFDRTPAANASTEPPAV